MPSLPIYRTLQRIPGGLMIVPLSLGAAIATLAPGAGAFFGSFTGALFSGALSILAVFYVCLGATLSLDSLSVGLRRGGALLGGKIATGMLVGVILGRFLGEQPVTSGWFAGISTLAVVAAMNDTNGGLYMALMQQYGDPRDASAYSVMSLESGPFFTMVTLGVAGLASFPWQTMLGAVLPLLVGIALGNLDQDMRKFLGQASPVMIPFFAFALGTQLDLRKVWQAGLLGIGLGLAVVAVSGTILYLADRLIGGTGLPGIASATTAANAAAVPALVAAANPVYAAAAGPATMLVAASIIVTALITPLVTVWFASKLTPRSAQTPTDRL